VPLVTIFRDFGHNFFEKNVTLVTKKM